MTTHYLKTWKIFFDQVLSGQKDFEYRRNDRNFYIGDLLLLNETLDYGLEYTGRQIQAVVTEIWGEGWHEMPGLSNGFVIMKIKLLNFFVGMDIEAQIRIGE